MILSVSRRTDIPAFYPDWFYNRMREGFVYVRNPMNPRQVSNIRLTREVIDCIVFWTKNPRPMMERLEEIREYPYYFQFTVTPYNGALEPGLPAKREILDTFRELSDLIGPERVVWRYDPVLLTDKMDIGYHIRVFEEMAAALASYTCRCVVSFMDTYKKTERNLRGIACRAPEEEEIRILAEAFVGSAGRHDITVESCAERYDLSEFGIYHGACIDKRVIEQITRYQLEVVKDKNQRKECNCVESVDIGEYNSCLHGCLYCYANASRQQVEKKRELHHSSSPLLIGEVDAERDVVKERKIVSCRLKGFFD